MRDIQKLANSSFPTEPRYFGVWEDPNAALETYNFERPYWERNQTPPDRSFIGGCDLRTLCNRFLESKESKMNSGDLSPRSFKIYHETCSRLIDHFGKHSKIDGFDSSHWQAYREHLASRYSPTTLKNEINRTRIVFNFAFADGLIDRPVNYGQSFDAPSARTLREHRNKGGEKVFTRDEVIAILGKCDPILRAMALMGINCGFGNTDVSTLPKSAIDLEGGWVNYPRPKTAIKRRIPLWDETAKALKEAIAKRPKPADKADDDLCFLTRNGNRWVRVAPKKTKNEDGEEPEFETLVHDDALAKKFRGILKELKINGRRNLGFYTLRHNFETIGGESRDQVAVDAIMGHVDSSMAGNYRHKISDRRLQNVVDVVHDWLWPPEENAADKEEGGDA